MAVLAAAQLLDELMGRNRNVAPHEKRKEPNWEDAEYCPYFMVKFCPHDLFVNTRADLGACSKVHDEEVKKLYEKAKSFKKIPYQEEFIRFCSSMVNEVERKIQKGKSRLALSGKNDVSSLSPAPSQKNQEQIDLLNERINGLEAEAEKAGTDGNVEQAQGLMKLCDQLKEERDALKKHVETGHWSVELAAAQEKLMEVCEVCGAFLIVGDAQQRIEDHLSGKQHQGFAKLKASVDEIIQAVQDAKEERRNSRASKLSVSDRERERDRDRRRDREHDRNRSEHKDKDRKEKEKDKDKERRDRERSEKKDREDHHRERDKNHKDRDKERERSKDGERERERERERKHHRNSDRSYDASRSSRHRH